MRGCAHYFLALRRSIREHLPKCARARAQTCQRQIAVLTPPAGASFWPRSTPKPATRKARQALAQFCRIYWRLIFAFIVRRVHSQEDAEDLTQEFFVKVLKGDLLRRADPARGRFRSLLLKAVKGFLNDAQDRSRRQKRGGEAKFIFWDEWMAEAPSHLMLPIAAEKNWPAEKVFDVRWAATIAEQALCRLQEECEAHKRPQVFDVLSGALTADRSDIH